ncbi:hypothetical protein ES703_110258 [subsurface metagenome]
MEPEEAIEEFRKPRPPSFWGQNPKLEKAMKLGIEALEFYKREKASNSSAIWTLLPGETEERPLYTLGFNTGDDESP